MWGRVGWVFVWVSLIVSLFSSLSRAMEAEGEERQQMKWFGCALLVLIFAYSFWPRGLLLFIVLALLPVAVGIAILKYGLYHLDIIINRALVYGSPPCWLWCTSGASRRPTRFFAPLPANRSSRS